MWVQGIKHRLSGLLVSPSAHWNYLASLTWHPKRHFINITSAFLGNSTVSLIFWLHMCVLCVYVCACVYVRASVCMCVCTCVCTYIRRSEDSFGCHSSCAFDLLLLTGSLLACSFAQEAKARLASKLQGSPGLHSPPPTAGTVGMLQHTCSFTQVLGSKQESSHFQGKRFSDSALSAAPRM